MRKIELELQLRILLKWGCDSMLNSTAVASVDESKCIIFSGPSLGHCPMGLGRTLDLQWMEKMADERRKLGD